MKLPISILSTLLLGMISVRAAGSLYDIPLKDIDGQSASLKPYQGKVLIVVNVASHCGYTPQYEDLQAVYQKYKDQGLVVLGFPCNQFGAQEPGSGAEIKQFCTSKYSVTFPMYEKILVNGPERHPLYKFLAGGDSPVSGDIKWNFTKFLVGRDGKILQRFGSGVKPGSTEMTAAAESALAAK